MRRKGLLIIMAILISLIATTMFIHAETEFFGGDGTITNPYQIKTKEHLDNVRNYPDASFVLINDIVFDDSDFQSGDTFYNDGKGWIPIYSFNGTFDGNGYAIKNLQCKDIDSFFFMRVEDTSVIKNLAFYNLNISNATYAGIVKENYGKMDNLFVEGIITAPLGSGIAYKNYGEIANCATNVTFDSCMEANGIATGNAGTVRDCINFSVNAGWNPGTNSGLIGGYEIGGAIRNCVNICGYGRTQCVGVDPLSGYPITNTYYLTTSAVQYATGATGVPPESLGSQTSFANLDFNHTWEMCHLGFPILKNNPIKQYINGLTNIHQPINNLKVEGHTYKSIKLSWDPVPNASGYLIVPYKTGSGRYIITQETSYIDSDITSLGWGNGYENNEVSYYVLPFYHHNGMTFYGTNYAYGAGRSIDVSTESTYADYVIPKLNSIKVLTEEVSKPGIIEVEVSATDMESGIGSIYVEGSYGTGKVDEITILEKEVQFDGEKEVSTIIKIPVPLDAYNGDFSISTITLKDIAGNAECFKAGMTFGGEKIPVSFTRVKDEFDIEFIGSLSNISVPTQIKNMDQGKTVVLKINEKSKGILKKEIQDAIKGQDKTVVVYADENASMQWIFYGKDITGTTKDINIHVKAEKVSGNRFGSKFDVIKLEYADNGKLPGNIQFRLKSKYISAINNSKDDLFLYYDTGKKLNLEQSNCPIIKDGNSNWCYIDLSHNSTFYLSSEELIKYGDAKFKGTVKLSKLEYVYTGNVKNPKLTVKTSDGKILKKGTDYTVSTPKGRKAIGRYAYTVKLKGNYSGTKTVTLTIKPIAPTIKNPTVSKKTITVKWKNVKKS